jgi:hypothetical protein
MAFNASNGTYQLFSKPGVSPCGTNGFTTVETQPIDVSDSGSIGLEDPDNAGGTPPSPVFDTRGRASTVSMIRLFDNNNGARVVFVQATGRVYVQ